MVEKPHEFATNVLQGVHIRKLKDQTGQLMTDHYLVERLAVDYPWIRSTYEHSSGYVHLSDKHIFNCMEVNSEEDRTVTLKISDQADDVPDAIYLEAVEAFSAATEVLLKYAHGWAFTKNNPDTVAEMRSVKDRCDDPS